jgi:hypothetical protein
VLSADKRMEFTASAFDIEHQESTCRKPVFFNVAGKSGRKASNRKRRQLGGLRLWGNRVVAPASSTSTM